MDDSKKTRRATKVAKDLRAYGVGLLRDASTVEDDGAKPSVHVDMKGGLTFRLPFDFNVAHFDVMKLICLLSSWLPSQKASQMASNHQQRRPDRGGALHQILATSPLAPNGAAGRY